MGLLYLRVGMGDGYKELWQWFEPYLNDPAEVDVGAPLLARNTACLLSSPGAGGGSSHTLEMDMLRN